MTLSMRGCETHAGLRGTLGRERRALCVHTPCETALPPTYQEQGYNKKKNGVMRSNRTKEDRKNETDASPTDRGAECIPGACKPRPTAPRTCGGPCLRGHWVASSGFGCSRTGCRGPTARHLPRARCRRNRVLRVCWVSSWVLETPPSLWLLWVPSWALAASSPPPLAPSVMIRSSAAHGCAERKWEGILG